MVLHGRYEMGRGWRQWRSVGAMGAEAAAAANYWADLLKLVHRRLGEQARSKQRDQRADC